MNIEEIKSRIIEAINKNINDDNLTIEEKWNFIHVGYHLLGHYKNSIIVLEEDECSGYRGGEKEFEEYRKLVLGE